MRAIVLCVLLLLSPLMAELGRADEDPRAAAAAHYARGIELANRGFYQAALEQFTAAYATSPNFAVLYNIGQAQLALGRPVEAIDSLSSYLSEGEARIPQARRAQVQAQIGLLESRLATLSIASDVPGVAIRIDGRDAGRTPLFQPIRLAAGTHTITGTIEGRPEANRVVTLGEGVRQRLELTLGASAPARPRAPAAAVPEPSLPEPPSPDATPPDIETRGRRLRLIAYVIAGVGALSWGTALGIYIWNRGRFQQWEATDRELRMDQSSSGSVAYSEQVAANNNLASSLNNANHAILGLSVVGGALVASGATVFLLDRVQRRDRGQVSIGWGGGSSLRLAWSTAW